ncbi:hypothetical protein ONS95_005593 [Cadophora gregata]|uniref:uncharacterized protein n=1 Tax=Cadophora gregata TaxID=51156 RepID=UPI0026DD83CA|nr:uncharacterized protein ONS95_005593 [Cadophora gregata]KAK0103579.1 hypothetical protein ONS95_005593 [Cadophora gregata]KAK0107771.1 hypothetical protein ONS96_003566 [Cadophora gregata f. sp. sojae]
MVSPKPSLKSVKAGRVTKSQTVWDSAAKSTPALQSFFGTSSSTAQSQKSKLKPKVHRATWNNAAALSSRLDTFVTASVPQNDSPNSLDVGHSTRISSPSSIKSLGPAANDCFTIASAALRSPQSFNAVTVSSADNRLQHAVADVPPEASTVLHGPRYQDQDAAAQLIKWFCGLAVVRGTPGNVSQFIEDTLEESNQQVILSKSMVKYGLHRESYSRGWYHTNSMAHRKSSTLAQAMQELVADQAALDTQPSHESALPSTEPSQLSADLQSQLQCLDYETTTSEWLSCLDTGLDTLWDDFVSDNVSQGLVQMASFLVKPSGSRMATLHLRWHYPTFSTKSPFFGVTADSSNPCLRMAFKKLGLQSGTEVFMDEAVYLRYSRVDKDDRLPYLKDQDLTRLHNNFASNLFSAGRIVLLLSEENFKDFKSSEAYGRSLGLMVWPNRKIYNQSCHIFIVYEDSMKTTITQIVILAWHTEGIMNQKSPQLAQQQDDLWNLAAALSGHKQPVNSDYFRWWVAENVKRKQPTFSGTPLGWIGQTPLNRILELITYEKLSGSVVAANELGDCLLDWVHRNSFTADQSSSLTIVRQIHRVFVTRATESQRVQGFPNLVLARAVLRNNNWPNLKKGHISLAASGHANLAKGRSAQRANGYDSLVKARAARKLKRESGGPKFFLSNNAKTASKTFDLFDEHCFPGTNSDPVSVPRKCSRCLEPVADDENPRFFNVRYPTSGARGSYNVRKIYYPLCVMAGSNADKYLCRSCPAAKVNKYVEYIPIDGKPATRANALSSPLTFLVTSDETTRCLWYGPRAAMQQLFKQGRVESNGKLVKWDGVRKSKLASMVTKYNADYPKYNNLYDIMLNLKEENSDMMNNFMVLHNRMEQLRNEIFALKRLEDEKAASGKECARGRETFQGQRR